MKKSEMVLLISEKLQKQMHMINSEKQRAHPKMLCDNLALRVMTIIEEVGMLPPPDHFEPISVDLDTGFTAQIDYNNPLDGYKLVFWKPEND